MNIRNHFQCVIELIIQRGVWPGPNSSANCFPLLRFIFLFISCVDFGSASVAQILGAAVVSVLCDLHLTFAYASQKKAMNLQPLIYYRLWQCPFQYAEISERSVHCPAVAGRTQRTPITDRFNENIPLFLVLLQEH